MLLIWGLAKFLSLPLNRSSCASVVNRSIYFFVSFRRRNRLSYSSAHHFGDVLNMNVYRKNRTYKIYFAPFFCSQPIKVPIMHQQDVKIYFPIKLTPSFLAFPHHPTGMLYRYKVQVWCPRV